MSSHYSQTISHWINTGPKIWNTYPGGHTYAVVSFNFIGLSLYTYFKAKENQNANAKSRLPSSPSESEMETDDDMFQTTYLDELPIRSEDIEQVAKHNGILRISNFTIYLIRLAKQYESFTRVPLTLLS